MKFLLLLLAVAFIWWYLRSRPSAPRRPSPPPPQEMVACHHCGLHVPEDEAVHHQGHTYCCPEHARRHQR